MMVPSGAKLYSLLKSKLYWLNIEYLSTSFEKIDGRPHDSLSVRDCFYL